MDGKTMVAAKIRATKTKYKRLGLSKFQPPTNPVEALYNLALARTWGAVEVFAESLERDYQGRMHKFIAHELKGLMAELKESILLEEK